MTNDEIAAAARSIQAKEEQISALQEEVEGLEDQIKAEMTSRRTETIYAGEFKIMWRTYVHVFFSVADFKAKYEELYKQFLKKFENKRFLIHLRPEGE